MGGDMKTLGLARYGSASIVYSCTEVNERAGTQLESLR